MKKSLQLASNPYLYIHKCLPQNFCTTVMKVLNKCSVLPIKHLHWGWSLYSWGILNLGITLTKPSVVCTTPIAGIWREGLLFIWCYFLLMAWFWQAGLVFFCILKMNELMLYIFVFYVLAMVQHIFKWCWLRKQEPVWAQGCHKSMAFYHYTWIHFKSYNASH